MAFFLLKDAQIALIILLIEAILVLALLMGWFLGARRLNIPLHHWMVYSSLPINLIIILLWMVPKPLRNWENLLKAPIKNWNLISHFFLGVITVLLATGVAITFLINREIPLSILRRVRPVMVAILVLWIVVFSIGIWNFYDRYIVKEEEEKDKKNGDNYYPFSSFCNIKCQLPFEKIENLEPAKLGQEFDLFLG